MWKEISITSPTSTPVTNTIAKIEQLPVQHSIAEDLVIGIIIRPVQIVFYIAEDLLVSEDLLVFCIAQNNTFSFTLIGGNSSSSTNSFTLILIGGNWLIDWNTIGANTNSFSSSH